MRITVYNIDGSELARWSVWQKVKYYDVPDISRPSFNLLANSDERCPYQIHFDDGQRQESAELATGVPLNFAIDAAICEYNNKYDPLMEY